MKIVVGQTYSIPSSHLSFEDVTPWSDDTFTVKPEAFEAFDHATLEEIKYSASGGEMLVRTC